MEKQDFLYSVALASRVTSATLKFNVLQPTLDGSTPALAANLMTKKRVYV